MSKSKLIIYIIKCSKGTTQQEQEIRETRERDSQEDNSLDEEEDRPFTEVVTRRTRNRRIQQAKRETVIGTKEDGELQAGERMAWLFVGRLKSTTTAETLKNYLGKNGIDGDVDVEEIQTRGRTKAFRVGFRFSHLEKTESADFWPKGVLALRFLFRRARYEGVSLDA